MAAGRFVAVLFFAAACFLLLFCFDRTAEALASSAARLAYAAQLRHHVRALLEAAGLENSQAFAPALRACDGVVEIGDLAYLAVSGCGLGNASNVLVAMHAATTQLDATRNRLDAATKTTNAALASHSRMLWFLRDDFATMVGSPGWRAFFEDEAALRLWLADAAGPRLGSMRGAAPADFESYAAHAPVGPADLRTYAAAAPRPGRVKRYLAAFMPGLSFVDRGKEEDRAARRATCLDVAVLDATRLLWESVAADVEAELARLRRAWAGTHSFRTPTMRLEFRAFENSLARAIEDRLEGRRSSAALECTGLQL